MSLSKYKECGILKIPAFLQNVCCVACSFKKIDVDQTFMQYIIAHAMNLNQVIDPQDDEFQILNSQQSALKKKAIASICLNLMDFYGINKVPLTHPGSYQPFVFEIVCDATAHTVGHIKRGNILEIFEADGQSQITVKMLEKMCQDCTKVVKPSHQYADLPIIIRDTCVTLKISSQEYEVTRFSDGIAHMESYNFEDHICSNFEDLMDQFSRVLNLISNVAMIQFDNTNIVDAEILRLAEFLDLIAGVYGDLEDMIVVCIYSYADFFQHGIQCKTDASVDFSSDKDAIPEQAGQVDAKLKSLDVE